MTRALRIKIAGTWYDEFTSGQVTRDLEDFSGSFEFTFRDPDRSADTFLYASPPRVFRLRPGPPVQIYADKQLVLKGWIEKVTPDINEDYSEIVVSGRDKAGDLVDSAALTDGPSEFHNVTLDEATRRIAAPFGLAVRSEIDPGAPFPRYALNLSETALSAIEKGARKRNALILSDGVGGIVLTRTGGNRAPADLLLPGNVKRSNATFSHENRHSETIVRAQAEKLGLPDRGRPAPIDVAGDPTPVGGRTPGDGSATQRERAGTALTGRARDPEITRYRPIVHLAGTQADAPAAQDEADWRMRTARVDAEQLVHVVRGYSVNGALWTTNQVAAVSDAFQGIHRDMLISRVTYAYEGLVEETEMTLSSPEGFDAQAVGSRRKNTAPRARDGLDSTAERL